MVGNHSHWLAVQETNPAYDGRVIPETPVAMGMLEKEGRKVCSNRGGNQDIKTKI